MAEKIELEVSLKQNLTKLSEETGRLKLDKGQQERFSKYSQGAQLALETGDLKTFQKNFNSLLKLFKEAAPATGRVSEEIKKFTAQQTALNQEINRLKDKKTSLEGKLTKDGSRLTAQAAREFATTNTDAKKVITGEGKIASRDQIIELQKALAEFLQKTGKKISEVTNENLQNNIKTSTGLTYKDRSSMFAGNRYVKAEQQYQAEVQTDLANTNSQIDVETENYVELTDQLTKMSQAAEEGAEDLSKLYAEISKLGDDTNKAVTDKLNKEKIEKIDRTGATGADPVGVKGLEKQASGLGKAFKQFTLYNVALRAVKAALREAVQTVKELDKYLTEQAMVTGLTREQTYGLVKSYQDLALQCGATTKEIAQVSTEYLKQGKSINEALVLTEAAVKAAKVARVGVGDSVNYLTTALNGFRLSADQAMKVSDKFAAIAAASATDYDELAIALSKVASQANLAGMSIDYTTALLTKGLETTREAPETMGTALKTIIARMRELGDYGETLDDGVDINNVESQLKYVGIALRDQQGELRSTEDVLDELGNKWDELGKNQQAAVAKALAGTRQQSRLIAMMEDYERVTELQEIAQRSAGATAAQAEIYLEGMEAAMNNIQVAWEKIVMSITDNKILITTIDYISYVLDSIGDFLQTDFGLVSTLTIVAGLTMTSLTNKMQEAMYAKTLNAAEQQRQIIKIKQRQNEIKLLIAAKQQVLLEKQKTLQDKAQLKYTTIQQKLDKRLITASEAEFALNQAKLDQDKEEAIIQRELSDLSLEMQANEMQLTTLNQTNASSWADIASTISMVGGGIGTLVSGSSEWLAIMTAVGFAFKIIPPIINVIKTINAMRLAQETAGETKKSFIQMAGAATGLGVPGLIIAAALMAAAGIATVAALVAGAKKQASSDTSADNINKLSNEIYKLTEKANAINNITSSFDKLDNKLIKTNADLKEMSSLLDQAADKLDDSIGEDEDIGYGVGISEKAYYNSLQSETERRNFLAKIQQKTEDEALAKRLDQINIVRGLSDEERKKLFTANDAKSISARDAIYASNNYALYDHIDALIEDEKLTSEQSKAVENFTQTILENMSAEEAWSYANDETKNKLKSLVKTIQNLTIEAKNLKGEVESVNVSKILTTDDYSLMEQVEAFKRAKEAIVQEYGKSSEEYSSFIESFKQYEFFVAEEVGNDLNTQALQFIDSANLDIKKLNDLYDSWEKLQEKGIKDKKGNLITQEVWKSKFDDYLNTLAKYEGDVLKATQEVFNEYLDGTEKSQNAFLIAYRDIIEAGALNMAQNMDKIKNSINNFYEKALEWDTLSESDKAEFRQDNFELFEGEAGKKLFDAFESGNYKRIEEALRNNETLQKRIKDQREQIRQELLIQEKLEGEEKDEVRITELKKYAKYLDDTANLFKASLEIRLEQQQKQLDEYRNMLEKEKEALTESLEKRKEAYEKYFDEISKEEEDAEYEEERDKLVTNITKLASSGDADSKKQTMELEQQLKELEAERLQALKERAREAILENMDNEVAEINDKFDKLLENNQALLAAMNGDLQDPNEFLSKLISNKLDDGLTQLEFEDYFKTLESTYGNTLSDVNWDEIKEEIINQLFLNVNGQDITLNEMDEKAVYDAVKKALRGIGKR